MNLNGNKKFFLPYDEHIVDGIYRFKEFKSEYPDELVNVINRDEYINMIKRFNSLMSESHNSVFLKFIKSLASIASLSIIMTFLWLIYIRVRSNSSVGHFMHESLPVVGIIALISFSLTILLVITFIIYKEISKNQYIKRLNQIYNERSITITCLGGLRSKYPPHTIEIQYPIEYQSTTNQYNDNNNEYQSQRTNEYTPLL